MGGKCWAACSGGSLAGQKLLRLFSYLDSRSFYTPEIKKKGCGGYVVDMVDMVDIWWIWWIYGGYG